jgi:hypothetical protein
MRDTLFLSHATPEDNEFTIWIASRLELLGYKVWIDKENLLGGETFWQDIKEVIEVNAVKFLLVYSRNICNKNNPNQVKRGIMKELDLAKSVVEKSLELKDFMLILNIDEAPYDLFPGSADINQISFSTNWATGLTLLTKKLIKDCVPKRPDIQSSNAATWYLDNYLIKNPIIKKKELYYTNWWNLATFPNAFYVLKFENETQATAVHRLNSNILSIRSANCIISFKEELNYKISSNTESFEIRPANVFRITASDLIAGVENQTFPTSRDAENYLKRLLKRALHNYLKERLMEWYELANGNLAYFHTTKSLPSSKIKFCYPSQEKFKTKNLVGRYLTIGKWHFALSFRTVLQPSFGFHLKTHVIFTTDGFRPIANKDLQHAYRRKKGRRMFNDEWRDLLIAFLNSLKNENGVVELITNAEEPIIMKDMVDIFWSDYGYHDPRDVERQSVLAVNNREEDEQHD